MATYEELLQEAYMQELGRAPDPEGLAFYSGLLSTGDRTLDQIIAEINLSEEGRLVDPTEVVASDLVYYDPTMTEDYIRNAYATELGREADVEGLQHYIDLVGQDEHTIATILQDISRSAEGITADPADLVFNEVLNQQIAADSGLFQPFEDIYTDTQSFADRTAAYVEESALRDQATTAAAAGDTVLADVLSSQADTIATTRGTTPWTTPTTHVTGTSVSTYDFDPVQAAAVAGLGQQMTTTGQEAAAQGVSIPTLIGMQAASDYNNSFNYGVHGKRPDETLEQYYKRLSTERQGGILGQGLLSAAPTPGSEAWENMQAINTASEVMQMFPTQTEAIVSASGTDYDKWKNELASLQQTYQAGYLKEGDVFIGDDGQEHTVGYGVGQVDPMLANTLKSQNYVAPTDNFLSALFSPISTGLGLLSNVLGGAQDDAPVSGVQIVDQTTDSTTPSGLFTTDIYDTTTIDDSFFDNSTTTTADLNKGADSTEATTYPYYTGDVQKEEVEDDEWIVG